MPKKKVIHEIRIFLASPGDVSEERNLAERIISESNRDICEPRNYRLKLIRWENDTYPTIDQDGQQVINKQLVLNEFQTYDLFIGIMWMKFGTPTPRAGSGTEEEYNLAHLAFQEHGLPHIMFYFNQAPPKSFPGKRELEGMQQVTEFKDRLKGIGLIGNYKGADDFGNQFRRHLNTYINDHFFKKKTHRKARSKKDIQPLIIPPDYATWLEDECITMDISELTTKGETIQVGLPAVYISLFTEEFQKDKFKKKQGRRGKQREENQNEVEKTNPIDIEVLIENEPYLLLEGDPGSGKTTMMKHLARSVLRGERLHGHLPVLVYLNNLNGFFREKGHQTPTASLSRKLLKYLCSNSENGLTNDVVEAYLKEGRVLILLDGLDELDEEFRAEVTDSFKKLYRKSKKGTKIIMTSRPHAIPSAMDYFGERHRKINALSWDQKEEFIHKWFDHLAGKGKKGRAENAEKLLHEIESRGEMMDFVNSPLILTAVCILYMDEKKLPEQRADLYNRIVNNLVEKRFRGWEFRDSQIKGMPEMVHRLLGKIAFWMMLKEAKTIDRVEAEKFLKNIFRIENSETEEEYIFRIRELFEKLEPDCGLLSRAGGVCSFYHLTYQEFLAARYLIHTGTDYWKVIQPHLDKKWWRESILLFIGFLELENPAWVKQIIENLLKTEKEDYLLLAAHALLDLQEGQREMDLVRRICERLEILMVSSAQVKTRMDAGEALGRLGDPRDLKAFVPIKAGEYAFQDGTTTIDNDFELSKYPVTNSRFREFVDEKGYEISDYWTEEEWTWLKKNEITEPGYWHDREWNVDNFPVIRVSWYEAKAFCNWLNTQNDGYIYGLPTEEQWEAVARGKEGREYPWGEGLKEEDDRCNYAPDWNPILGRTSPVGMFPKGDTKEGLSDMAGNVWEWCDDQDGSNRVIRGGCWSYAAGVCTAAFRSRSPPADRAIDVGFRLARSRRTDEAPARGAEH